MGEKLQKGNVKMTLAVQIGVKTISTSIELK